MKPRKKTRRPPPQRRAKQRRAKQRRAKQRRSTPRAVPCPGSPGAWLASRSTAELRASRSTRPTIATRFRSRSSRSCLAQCRARRPPRTFAPLLLTATGPTFCAGADLKEDPKNLGSRAKGMLDLFDELVRFPVPVVIELNGNVRAGGLGFLGAADIVIAPKSATFAFTEVRLGVVPAIIAITIMPKMSARAVSRYFLTGETFHAREAAECGLISECVEDERVHTHVESLLDTFRLAAPSALRATKKLIRERAGLPCTRAALEEAGALSASIFASDDAMEGMLSFREKRAPHWAQKT